MAAPNPPDNPYLAARQEWNERYGSYVTAAATWRTIGIIAMVIELAPVVWTAPRWI
ncbi:type IV secretory pathway TrbF-like protein [Bradyrhizobium liaoningense]